MKKLALTFAIVLGMTMTTFAQGGLFGKGETRGIETRDGETLMPIVPSQHGLEGDQNGAPLGGGLALLIGFGAAYALKKNNEK